MPYKVSGNQVLKKEGDTWKVKQTCKSHEAALRAKVLLDAIEHDPDFKPRK